jgi:DNA-binding MarR family transcriptional regulator
MSVDRTKSKFADKWPDEKVTKRGFAAVPKCLITCMAELGLKPQEASVLLIIVEKCWVAGDKAWPSVNYISTAIGRKPSATRAITKSLAVKEFITKEQRYYNKSNLYGLELTAHKLAKHMLVCTKFAKYLARDSQKTGGHDSQESSDYIETSLRRNTYVETNKYSHDFIKNEVGDQSSTSAYASCPAMQGYRHRWYQFEKRPDNSEKDEDIIYYLTCINNCGAQYHKKGKPPFNVNEAYLAVNEDPDDPFNRLFRINEETTPSEKRLQYNSLSPEHIELPQEPINLDDFDW